MEKTKIKNRFEEIRGKYPVFSDWVCLCEALNCVKYTRNEIVDGFNELVSKKEYYPSQKENLEKYLVEVFAY